MRKEWAHKKNEWVDDQDDDREWSIGSEDGFREEEFDDETGMDSRDELEDENEERLEEELEQDDTKDEEDEIDEQEIDERLEEELEREWLDE